jgi:translation initiation factor 4A
MTNLTNNTIKTYPTFDSMNLNEKLLRGIYAYGFELPSAVQKKGIVPAISGKDCIVQAQSGTGKTATFVISILQKIDAENKTCQALVLEPTRELAEQSYNVMVKLAEYMDINIYRCIGGRRVRDDLEKLSSGVQVVVGTPGRVYDMICRGKLRVEKLQMFVLDEADEMLSQGFKDQIYNICEYMNEEVQIAIYSATMPEEVLEVTKSIMLDPVQILVKKENVTLDGIKQFYVKCDHESWKFDVICDIYNLLNVSQSIIFCNTKRKAIWLSEELQKKDFTVSLIHGEMEQEQRNVIMNQFRECATRVLITTDLLARGIDVHHVSLVINFDLPSNKENYIHRVGRCARFGRKGVAINFITPRDMRYMKMIEKYYHTQIEEMPDDITEFMH